MPGGRLSQQERQRIASGLADGLAYAEIARGLDRPTSTVTREVMRNGGPVGYRADLAHRATENRAHRRKKAAPRAGGAGGSGAAGVAGGASAVHGRDGEAVREYEDAFATLFTQQGLPHMTSRVLAALYVTDSGSLTAGELGGRLGVSAASVSKAIAFLEVQGLVRREREAEGRRRERYVVDDDVMYQSTMASAKATAYLAGVAREGVGVMGAGTPAAVRLENMARFMDFVSESIARAADQAREVLYAKPGWPHGESEVTPE
ncbi:helix-turn-helix domain-containing protein [Streptomyces sp. NPDC004539]|uniref:helix-turn-helix domain-containing protein n=1 Tax=Streptomyces sp. NPDC004539 TaxID=3154280 RepID=UPI0033A55BC3